MKPLAAFVVPAPPAPVPAPDAPVAAASLELELELELPELELPELPELPEPELPELPELAEEEELLAPLLDTTSPTSALIEATVPPNGAVSVVPVHRLLILLDHHVVVGHGRLVLRDRRRVRRGGLRVRVPAWSGTTSPRWSRPPCRR